MDTSTYQDTIQSLYIAYYGRPADFGGLEAWTLALEAANGDVSQIIDAFANSPEAQERFGGLSSEETIIRLYNQLFDRDPESQEIIDRWVDQLDNNPDVTAQSIALDLLQGAQNQDAQVVANRLEAANAFTQYLKDLEETHRQDAGVTNGAEPTEPHYYAGAFAAEHAANWLSTVKDDQVSLDNAVADLDRFIPEIHMPATYSADNVSVEESEGVAHVVFERTGGLYTHSSVFYTTEDGTADAGDYNSGTGGFGFFDFGDEELTVSFSIVQDDVPEGDEFFFVNYENDNIPSRAKVTILGDIDGGGNTVDDVFDGIFDVLILDNPFYTGDGHEGVSDEAYNLEVAVNSFGDNYIASRESADTNAELAPLLEDADVYLMTELEGGSAPSYSDAIEEFVSSGGTFVVFFPWNGGALDFVNDTFSFALSSAWADTSFLQTTNVAGTSFADNNLNIPDANATIAVSNLPAGSVSVYETGAGDTTVAIMEYGDGEVVVMGWDFYHAAPHGFQDGGWLEVLNDVVDLGAYDFF